VPLDFLVIYAINIVMQIFGVLIVLINVNADLEQVRAKLQQVNASAILDILVQNVINLVLLELMDKIVNNHVEFVQMMKYATPF
jgi:hypothetical protein